MRIYTDDELRALRTVTNREWKGSGDPEVRGPAQFAGGHYWPNELREMAREFERLIPTYRLAADALEREIATGRDGNLAGVEKQPTDAPGGESQEMSA